VTLRIASGQCAAAAERNILMNQNVPSMEIQASAYEGLKEHGVLLSHVVFGDWQLASLPQSQAVCIRNSGGNTANGMSEFQPCEVNQETCQTLHLLSS
jgi:hypothetical protein